VKIETSDTRTAEVYIERMGSEEAVSRSEPAGRATTSPATQPVTDDSRRRHAHSIDTIRTPVTYRALRWLELRSTQ